MLLTTDQQHVLNFLKSSIEDMGWSVSNPIWSSSNEDVVTVVPSEDGYSANVVAQSEGSAMVSCVVTVDQNNGDVYDQLALTVVGVMSPEGAMALEETVNMPKE
jgi:hypothetical protein